jgi:hypothetical protein
MEAPKSQAKSFSRNNRDAPAGDFEENTTTSLFYIDEK